MTIIMSSAPDLFNYIHLITAFYLIFTEPISEYTEVKQQEKDHFFIIVIIIIYYYYWFHSFFC